ncbi:MAG: FAD-binding oxidoreductase [Pseudomonadota bacterium]
MTGYLTANDRPGEHAKSWYADTANPLPDHPPLQGEAEADLCIVGAGYAGLSAALHAAERGLNVIVLEANRIGWGASGRNGGQVGIGPRADINSYERKVGPDDARKVWEMATEANALVRRLIRDHTINCDLTDGYVECAWKPGHAADAHEYVEHISKTYGHTTARPIDRVEITELLGTDAYHGGFVDRMGGHLHPLNYALGLGQATAGAGARIHERSMVTKIEAGRVTTSDGHVRAPQILLACNGYLDGLMAAPQRRMMPLNNYILATEPLGERTKSLNPQNLCASDTLFVLNYFRLSRDGRMLWGGGESLGRRFPSDLKSFVRERMLMVYPDLADVTITHAWGGTLAITGTRIPVFQDLGHGIRAIGGWSGSGVHMATMGGKIAAEAIAGEVGDWDLLARMPTPQFPGGDWFRMPFLRLAMFWYRLRDRL